MANLREGTVKAINNKAKYLHDVIKALELLNFLPEEILTLQGEVDYNKWSDEETLSIRVYGYGESKNAVDILKQNGVQGLIYEASSPTFFNAKGGSCVLSNGMTAYFEVWGAEKPKNCILEEVPTTAYKIVCAESIGSKS